MWLELEHTTHRCFLQFAAVRQLSSGIKFGVVFLTALFSVSLKMGATSLLVVLVPRLGGSGCQNFFFDQFFVGGSSLVLAAALKPFTETSRCWGARWRGGGVFPLLQAQGRDQSLVFLRSGAACRCWLGTWPHDPLPGGSMPLLV